MSLCDFIAILTSPPKSTLLLTSLLPLGLTHITPLDGQNKSNYLFNFKQMLIRLQKSKCFLTMFHNYWKWSCLDMKAKLTTFRCFIFASFQNNYPGLINLPQLSYFIVFASNTDISCRQVYIVHSWFFCYLLPPKIHPAQIDTTLFFASTTVNEGGCKLWMSLYTSARLTLYLATIINPLTGWISIPKA